MVGYPVQDYFQSQGMCLGHKIFKISLGTEIRVNGIIIAHRIWAAFIARVQFPALHTNGMNGHDPQYINPQFAQPGKPGAKAGKISRRRKLSHIALIQHCTLDPIWFRHDLYVRISRCLNNRGRLVLTGGESQYWEKWEE